jgi:hypothetical protein
LTFDLNQSAIVINDTSIIGIHFDLSNNNIYIATWNTQSIYIYHTNDEITFNKTSTIKTSHKLESITIYNDKIYTGSSNGTVLVYNKTSYALLQVMDNMCESFIYSLKFYCISNMIYSCFSPPMVRIIGTNGINTTFLLNDTFTEAFDTYIDSKNRLWIGGNNGFVVYN